MSCGRRTCYPWGQRNTTVHNRWDAATGVEDLEPTRRPRWCAPEAAGEWWVKPLHVIAVVGSAHLSVIRR